MKLAMVGCLVATLLAPLTSSAALIEFNDLGNGQTSYAVDVNGDGGPDVIFSTTDPAGFNRFGPGANQQFINEPGLEGTTLLSPDLRVDFPHGAVDNVAFGFAVSIFHQPVANALQFFLFDVQGISLGSVDADADFSPPSDFAENHVSLDFAGIAAFGLFDFSDSRYILDNFEFTPASAPPQLNEPSGAMCMVAMSISLFMGRKRWKRRPENPGINATLLFARLVGI